MDIELVASTFQLLQKSGTKIMEGVHLFVGNETTREACRWLKMSRKPAEIGLSITSTAQLDILLTCYLEDMR